MSAAHAARIASACWRSSSWICAAIGAAASGAGAAAVAAEGGGAASEKG